MAKSLRLIRYAARIVRPRHELTVAQDPGDNWFLECAEAARADYLVTVNKRHFPKSWRQTLVVKPANWRSGSRLTYGADSGGNRALPHSQRSAMKIGNGVLRYGSSCRSREDCKRNKE